jgi:hypothetical protein
MQFSGPSQRHLVWRADDENLCPPLRLADMSIWSIQATASHYCTPRTDYRVAFIAAEVAVIHGEHPEAWQPWRKGGVYAWLPLALIDQEIEKRGGLVDTG